MGDAPIAATICPAPGCASVAHTVLFLPFGSNQSAENGGRIMRIFTRIATLLLVVFVAACSGSDWDDSEAAVARAGETADHWW